MQKKIFLHLLVWVAYCLLLSLFYSRNISFDVALYLSLITVGFQAALVYANIGLWLPAFLRQQRIGLYILAVVCTFVLLTVIRLQIPPLVNEYTNRPIGLKGRMFFFETSLMLAYSLSTAYYFLAEWFVSQKIKTETKYRQVQNELKYLKDQINPHFLFNTLNNIYTLCYLKDDKAAPAVLKLSEMMRYMLHESNVAEIELEREIRFIQNYLELQQLKKDESMNIVFEVDGVRGRHRVAPLILIAFFENCFKHGDIETNPQGWVKAQLSVSDAGQMTLKIGNSKKQSTAVDKSRKSVGLENVQQRLALLYENRYQLHIEDNEHDYHVYLTLQLEV